MRGAPGQERSREEERERDDRRREQATMRNGGCDNERQQRRQCERGEDLCGVPPPSVPLTTASSAAPSRGERRQSQRQARRVVRSHAVVPARRTRSPCTKPGRNGKR